MRRLLASCAALWLALAARPAGAQVAGQFGGAAPIAVDTRVFGGYLGVAQHQFEGLAQLRLSFYPGVDFGFQGGVHHYGESGVSRNAIEIGGDVRTIVTRQGPSTPCDVSLGGAIEVSSADHYNLLSVGPTVAASRRYAPHVGSEFVPYAGAALLYSRTDVGIANSTDVSLPLRFGLEYGPNPSVRTVLELQLPLSDNQGSHPKLIFGANFPF